jgi:hypothetical protein
MDSVDDVSGWAVVTETRSLVSNRRDPARWQVALLLCGALGLAAFGCKQSPASEEAPGQVTQAASASAEGARASFDEGPFVLQLVSKGSYQKGKEGEVEIHLKAKSGFKCNDKYPYKFKAKASPELAFASDVVRKDAVRFDGKHEATMPVKFTPKAAGKQTVAGRFSFSLCTEEQCLVERRELALAIDVQ